MARVVQISDTHLGRGKAHFSGNWPFLAAWIEAEAPDLVIHSGDVSLDGADVDDDLAYSAEIMAAPAPRPFLAVPGNHDVGDPFSLHQPLERRAPRALAGAVRPRPLDPRPRRLAADRLRLDDPLGSGLPEEEAQFAWLEAAMRGADGRRIAWFRHQPLFIRAWARGRHRLLDGADRPARPAHERSPTATASPSSAPGTSIARTRCEVDRTAFVWCLVGRLHRRAGAAGAARRARRWLGAVSLRLRRRARCASSACDCRGPRPLDRRRGGRGLPAAAGRLRAAGARVSGVEIRKRRQVLRRAAGPERASTSTCRRRVPDPGRPLGLRQVHPAAHHRRPRAAGHAAQVAIGGRAGRPPAAARARRRHGVPVLRALSAHDGGARTSRCR